MTKTDKHKEELKYADGIAIIKEVERTDRVVRQELDAYFRKGRFDD